MRWVRLRPAWGWLFLLTLGWSQGDKSREVPFTQEDKERLIRIEITLENFMKATDQRFQALEKRMDRLEERMDRLEDRTLTLSVAILTLLVGLIGYTVWERQQAKREKAKDTDLATRLEVITQVLRDLAKTDERIAQTLREHHLL